MAETNQTTRTQVKIVVPDDHSMVALLGSRDELLQVIEGAFDSDVHVRGNEITVTGPPDETKLVTRLFEELFDLLKSGTPLTADAVERSVAMLRAETGERPAEVLTLDILSSRGRTIRPKTLNQKHYVDAIDEHTIVFGIGPAGTIEVAPLAYMRGRTINDSFIILDEAQNTTAEQMKMFLTRLGFGSKVVVTGDVTQVDLPSGSRSGLRVVRDILEGLDDIAFCTLTSRDVVRHKLVGAIVDAYSRYDSRSDRSAQPGGRNARKRGR